jgi:hypothetical protein
MRWARRCRSVPGVHTIRIALLGSGIVLAEGTLAAVDVECAVDLGTSPLRL